MSRGNRFGFVSDGACTVLVRFSIISTLVKANLIVSIISILSMVLLLDFNAEVFALAGWWGIVGEIGFDLCDGAGVDRYPVSHE